MNLLQKTIECRNARYGMFSSIFMAPCFYIGKDDDLIGAFMTAFIDAVADITESENQPVRNSNAIKKIPSNEIPNAANEFSK